MEDRPDREDREVQEDREDQEEVVAPLVQGGQAVRRGCRRHTVPQEVGLHTEDQVARTGKAGRAADPWGSR